MLATDVQVKSITSSSDCWKIIDLIESDYRNYIGGITAWNSGKQVTPKPSTILKINAIEKRAHKLSTDIE